MKARGAFRRSPLNVWFRIVVLGAELDVLTPRRHFKGTPRVRRLGGAVSLNALGASVIVGRAQEFKRFD